MKILYSALILLLAVSACGNKSDNPLYDEVMKIHDDVMPKVGDMAKLSRELKEKKKTLSDSALIANYDARIAKLTEAEEAMYDWMRAFDMPSEETKIEAYLQEEKVKIKEVSDMMLSSIDEAQKILNAQ